MGFIRHMEERSGILLRRLLAFSALLGIIPAIATVSEANPAGILMVAAFVGPYLVIRHRDPDSTTLPFRQYLDGTAR